MGGNVGSGGGSCGAGSSGDVSVVGGVGGSGCNGSSVGGEGGGDGGGVGDGGSDGASSNGVRDEKSDVVRAGVGDGRLQAEGKLAAISSKSNKRSVVSQTKCPLPQVLASDPAIIDLPVICS
ncbi:uncharacterized protein LOC128248070 [Octopus bimaculoides]|uniref:uncharacterized protein LOC128248070 n=1 Tax=Octopus bimaculoides TaxID=37653 RepID=UPI0022E48606|nr:uncharacterized protein LOC128248070 [Octopus bimaculoides]